MNRVIAALAALLAVLALTVSADAAPKPTVQTSHQPVAKGKLRTEAGYKVSEIDTGVTCKVRPKHSFVPGTVSCQVTQSSWIDVCWPTFKAGKYNGSWCPLNGRDPMLSKTGALMRGPHTLGVHKKGRAVYKMVLANGETCTRFGLDGMSYACGPTNGGPHYLTGQPNRTHPSWTVQYNDPDGNISNQTVHVNSAVWLDSPYGLN